MGRGCRQGHLAPALRDLPSTLCRDLWLGLVPIPLVLESEGPRLEGVEGEVSELRGEEKPSWGRSTLGQPAGPPGLLARERGGPSSRTMGHSGKLSFRQWGQWVAAASS